MGLVLSIKHVLSGTPSTLVRPLLSVITVLSVSLVLLRTPTFVRPLLSVITVLSMSPVLLRTPTVVKPVLSVIIVL